MNNYKYTEQQQISVNTPIPERVKKILNTRINKITENGFKDPLEWMEYVLKTVDIIFKYQSGDLVVCKRGCSHCCYVPVEVTNVEAFYIQQKTGRKAADLTKPAIIQPDKTPCPFLVNCECSIHEFRPIACRSFGTIDSADYCAQGGDVSHMITTSKSSAAIFEITKLVVKIATEQKGLASHADIRKWFK